MSARQHQVRLSVAVLVNCVSCGDDRKRYLALLNSKGDRWHAIGGAIKLMPKGKDYLVSTFGAHSFEDRPGDEMDARFRLPAQHAQGCLTWFQQEHGDMYELTPDREVIDELTDHGKGGVISVEAAQDISFVSLGWHYQPAADDTQQRLFHMFEMRCSERCMQELQASEEIRELTPSEIDGTNGGRSQGKANDGRKIADNIWRLD